MPQISQGRCLQAWEIRFQGFKEREIKTKIKLMQWIKTTLQMQGAVIHLCLGFLPLIGHQAAIPEAHQEVLTQVTLVWFIPLMGQVVKTREVIGAEAQSTGDKSTIRVTLSTSLRPHDLRILHLCLGSQNRPFYELRYFLSRKLGLKTKKMVNKAIQISSRTAWISCNHKSSQKRVNLKNSSIAVRTRFSSKHIWLVKVS